MMSAENVGLPAPARAGIMRARVKSAVFLALYLSAGGALAQERAQQSPESKRDDLDVTLQIIVDPDAKLPDEVVRRIPLPARKPADPSEQGAGNQAKKSNAAEAQERAREAQELGREMADSAKQRAQEAAEQREQARRAAAEENRRNNPPGPPTDPPRGPPPRP